MRRRGCWTCDRRRALHVASAGVGGCFTTSTIYGPPGRGGWAIVGQRLGQDNIDAARLTGEGSFAHAGASDTAGWTFAPRKLGTRRPPRRPPPARRFAFPVAVIEAPWRMGPMRDDKGTEIRGEDASLPITRALARWSDSLGPVVRRFFRNLSGRTADRAHLARVLVARSGGHGRRVVARDWLAPSTRALSPAIDIAQH